jgi:hypothetical protein
MCFSSFKFIFSSNVTGSYFGVKQTSVALGCYTFLYVALAPLEAAVA